MRDIGLNVTEPYFLFDLTLLVEPASIVAEAALLDPDLLGNVEIPVSVRIDRSFIPRVGVGEPERVDSAGRPQTADDGRTARLHGVRHALGKHLEVLDEHRWLLS